MRKKKLLIIVFLFASISIFSQDREFEKPDYKKIEKETSKRNSEFYYPKLMEKFINSDTNMTTEEKRYLYYGYVFQNSYSPYGHSDYSDSLRSVLQKEQYNNEELLKIVEFSDSCLAEDPFDLRTINYQLYACEKLGEDIKFENRMNQMLIIIDALLSSGDGLEKNTAFYVINVSHEYDLLSILGFEFGGQQSLIEHYDYLKVAENSENIDGLYFDISPSLNSLDKMFK